MSDHYPPIGILKTCFTEKFGVPRQSLMMKEAHGVLKLNSDSDFHAALNHLSEFSHIWIIFRFHKSDEKKWHPIIDPPRLGIDKQIGVFASRSPLRPNPIGLSAVRLERIDFEATGGIELHVSGVDILDGTPVLDLKPYLPFADRIDDANSGWAVGEIERYPVNFSKESLSVIEKASQDHPRIKQLIQEMLEMDPRPTSQKRNSPIEASETEGMKFAFRVLGLDVQWQVREKAFHVFAVVPF